MQILDPMIEKYSEGKLISWKFKELLIGGKLTLNKYVLGTLYTYYFSSFKALQKVTNALESLRRRFSWNIERHKKKMYFVKWKVFLLIRKTINTVRTLVASLELTGHCLQNTSGGSFVNKTQNGSW